MLQLPKYHSFNNELNSAFTDYWGADSKYKIQFYSIIL